MRLQCLNADIRQHQGPAAFFGLQFLQDKPLANALQLLADLDLARLDVYVIPTKARRFA